MLIFITVFKLGFMKRLLFYGIAVLIFGLFSQKAGAQKIYSCNDRYDADIKVFVVGNRNDADLLVYKVEHSYEAEGNKGLWFFCQNKYDSKKNIWFADNRYDADLLIFFVENRYDAGWKDKKKMYLLY